MATGRLPPGGPVEVGARHGRRPLAAPARDERLRRAGIEAARVDHRRLPALELDLAVEAIARHARRVTDERLPASDEAIEQRGLADVRPADDRDYGAEHTAESSALGSGSTTRTGTPTAAARAAGLMSSRKTPSRSRSATAGATTASPRGGSVARCRAMSSPVRRPATDTGPPKKRFATAATRAVAPGIDATRRASRGA